MKKLEKMMQEGIETNDLKKVALALNLGLSVEAELNGYSPLYLAVLRGNIALVEILISAGVNVNAKDNGGHSPLHFAVDRDNVAIVKLLISAGADVNAKTNGGNSPLHWAVRRGYVEMQALLKKHGATI